MKTFGGSSGRVPDFGYIISTFTIDYFLVPILSGIYGFISFFVIIMAVKIFLNAAGNEVSVNPSVLDLQISAIGFILGYGLKVIRNLE
ncbi:MAG TPA: hypothetical protein VMT35_15740 [Ignavibacteriaceae bacterium]|nr:hypothetical protein [Ignavibacteriaceae bacterium]